MAEGKRGLLLVFCRYRIHLLSEGLIVWRKKHDGYRNLGVGE